MLQRQLLAPLNGFNRKASYELQATPYAKPAGACHTDSFHRKVTAGHGNVVSARPRQPLLAKCLGPNGTTGDSDSGDASFGEGNAHHIYGQHNWVPATPHQQQQAQDGGSSCSDGKPRELGPPTLRPENSAPLITSWANDELNWDFRPEPYVPNPANLPTNGDDEPLLFPPRHLPSLYKDPWTLTGQPGIDLLTAGPQLWCRLDSIFVILFGVGERATEGIYSLRAFSSDGNPQETIIAFECEEEAQRYACLLEAAMEHTPRVCSIPPRKLLTFCIDQAYDCRLEPKGSLLIPPDVNVSVTDWERSLRLRDGNFAVLESEPERRYSSSGSASATAAAVTTMPAPVGMGGSGNPQQSGGMGIPSDSVVGLGGLGLGGVGLGGGVHGGPASSLARYSGLSGSELELIRARLEALLPSDGW